MSQIDIKPALVEIIRDIDKGYALPADLREVLEIALNRIIYVEQLESRVLQMEFAETRKRCHEHDALLHTVGKFFNWIRTLAEHKGEDS